MANNYPTRYLEIFTRIIGTEGGYSNRANDPGGETKFGISKRSYPNLDIANLTVDDVQQIYYNDFYMKLRLDLLPVGLDEFVFDFAVNSGVPTVARILQRAVGVLPDGVIGPITAAAIKATDTVKLVRLLFVERAIIFAGAPKATFDENCHGWYARLFDQTKLFFTQ